MLTKTEIATVIRVFEPYLPKTLGIFGSVARNESHANSDIDILYTLEGPISLFTLARLQITLEEKLDKKVDLVSEGALHPKLKSSILKDLKILYAA